LYNSDARSYVDNAIGGSGNDSLVGNAIANVLHGAGGNDTLVGGTGVDVLTGGDGADNFVFASGDSSAASGHDQITDVTQGVDLEQRPGQRGAIHVRCRRRSGWLADRRHRRLRRQWPRRHSLAQ